MNVDAKKNEVLKIIRDVENADVYVEFKRRYPQESILDDEVNVLVSELRAEGLVTESRGGLMLSSRARQLLQDGGYEAQKNRMALALKEGDVAIKMDKIWTRTSKTITIIMTLVFGIITAYTGCKNIHLKEKLEKCERRHEKGFYP